MSYITLRIIAMAYPSSGLESQYRNSRNEVVKFFEKRHKDKYKVYNLCIEENRCYDGNVFNAFAHYPFYDHNAPTFEDIYLFCKDAGEWLNKDKVVPFIQIYSTIYY